MRYLERLPHPTLRELVECHWFLEADADPAGASSTSRILPDGCMDLLFDLAGSGVGRPPQYAVGTMTRSAVVTHVGRVSLVGVRFRPGGARPFLAPPAGELTDDIGDLAAVAGRWDEPPGIVRERLAAAPTLRAKTALLDGLLAGTIGRGDVPDRVVLRAGALLDGRDAPPAPVGRVAEVLGVSRRHLERRFGEEVGISPGVLARVGRLRRAIRLLEGRSPSLARTAGGAGYHDQAHMTREFGVLAGMTPGAYRDGERG